MSKYIIIDAEAIQKRIEELEKDPIYLQWEYDIKTHNGHSPQQRERKKIVDLELELLKEILSQSTPLIPEIEKAYNAGKIYNDLSVAGFDNPQGRYISNLKLDI